MIWLFLEISLSHLFYWQVLLLLHTLSTIILLHFSIYRLLSLLRRKIKLYLRFLSLNIGVISHQTTSFVLRQKTPLLHIDLICVWKIWGSLRSFFLNKIWRIQRLFDLIFNARSVGNFSSRHFESIYGCCWWLRRFRRGESNSNVTIIGALFYWNIWRICLMQIEMVWLIVGGCSWGLNDVCLFLARSRLINDLLVLLACRPCRVDWINHSTANIYRWSLLLVIVIWSWSLWILKLNEGYFGHLLFSGLRRILRLNDLILNHGRFYQSRFSIYYVLGMNFWRFLDLLRLGLRDHLCLPLFFTVELLLHFKQLFFLFNQFLLFHLGLRFQFCLFKGDFSLFKFHFGFELDFLFFKFFSFFSLFDFQFLLELFHHFTDFFVFFCLQVDTLLVILIYSYLVKCFFFTWICTFQLFNISLKLNFIHQRLKSIFFCL